MRTCVWLHLWAGAQKQSVFTAQLLKTQTEEANSRKLAIRDPRKGPRNTPETELYAGKRRRLNALLVNRWNNTEQQIQAENVSKLKCKLSCCCKTKCIPHKRLPERREEEAWMMEFSLL